MKNLRIFAALALAVALAAPAFGQTNPGTSPLSILKGGTSAATASAARTALGLAIGTDVQAFDAELAALAGLTSANNKCFYFTGSGTAAVYDCSSFGRSVANAADAAALRTLAGAIPLATGVSGILPYANGGSAASTAWTQGSVLFGGAAAFAEDNANLFWDDANNRLGIGTAAPTARLTVSRNATAIAAAGTNVMAQLVAADATNTTVEVYSHGTGVVNTINGFAASGTAASPGQLKSGQGMWSLGGFGYFTGGSSGFTTGSKARIQMQAAEDWTDVAQGTKIVGSTTPIGSTTRADVYTVSDVGNFTIAAALATKTPSTFTGTSGTVSATDSAAIFNPSGGFTATLPAAATYPGRWLYVKSIAAQTVTSASSNVVPLAGGAAGTAILAATAGKWAILQSNGTNWEIFAAN